MRCQNGVAGGRYEGVGVDSAEDAPAGGAGEGCRYEGADAVEVEDEDEDEDEAAPGRRRWIWMAAMVRMTTVVAARPSV